MTEFLIRLAAKLEASTRYNNFKTFTYNILENNSYKYKKYFDFFMIFVVLSTVGVLLYDVNHTPMKLLEDYEFYAMFIFIIEYLGRFWVYNDNHKIILEDHKEAALLSKDYKISQSFKKMFKTKIEFIRSPMAMIDLFAILPYYRPLRILRIFLLFRLFKILRYSNSIKEFGNVLKERQFEFMTLGLLFITAILFSSSIIYIYEGGPNQNDNINTMFDAIYWSIITISTVGYGDIIPITVAGKIVTLFCIIIGVLIIAFSTSIIVTGLSEKMKTIKEERVQTEANKIEDFIIICGFGKMGRYICAELEKLKYKFIIIEIDLEKVEKAKKENYLVVQADCTNVEVLENLNIQEAKDIIILTQNDAVNLSTVLSARSLCENVNIISRVNHSFSEHKFYIAGANKTIIFNDSAAFAATEYLYQPIAYRAFDELLLNFDTPTVMDEIEVVSESSIIGQNVDIIDFKKYNLTLVSVMNSSDMSSFIFNPLGKGYILRTNDILIVIGFTISVNQLKSDLINKKFKVKDV